jgi:hypothetical protein
MSVLPTTNLVCPDVSFILRESFEQYLAKAREYLTSHRLGDFRKCPALYRPYLAGTADERQYRVMLDREQWFRVVMGQDEVARLITPETEVAVPLPEAISADLTFSLSVDGNA